MRKVAIKRLLIYKDHIFPEVKKPIRSLGQYLVEKNPDLDRQKAKKMAQLLDQEEKKKLKLQKDQTNDLINIDLQKYYRKYIQSFQTCPDYYSMLFKYAIQKVSLLSQNHQISNAQQPFFLSKKNILKLTKLINNKQDAQQRSNKTNENPGSLILQHVDQKQIKSKNQQKFLFDVYQQLYPSEKQQVFNRFIHLYKEFILKNEQISKKLLEQQIVHIKPFIFTSTLQLFQSKHHQWGLQECQKKLLENVISRDKFNAQFVKLIDERKNEIHFLQSKYQTQIHEIWTEYRKQYYYIDKYQNFYSMLQNR